MLYQAVVKLGDRVWSSIRDTKNQALFRVSEHIKQTDPEMDTMVKTVQSKLIFGQLDKATMVLSDHGFTFEFKEIGE